MSRPRGYALMLVLVLMAALAVSSGVVWSRVRLARSLDRAQAARLEALWLARSAALAAKAGELKVEGGSVRTEAPRALPGGERAVVAEARLAGGTARVEARLDAQGRALAWKETFERAGAPR